MSDDLAQLERQRAEINERIDEIQTAKAERVSAALVGRYFKYRNNYSCPESDEDYWWLYMKVTGFDGSRLSGYSFQRDSDGKSFFDPAATTYNHLSGYEEITAQEFIRARAEFLTKLTQEAA